MRDSHQTDNNRTTQITVENESERGELMQWTVLMGLGS